MACHSRATAACSHPALTIGRCDCGTSPPPHLLQLQLQQPLAQIPAALSAYRLELAADGNELIYTYDQERDQNGIVALLEALDTAGITFKDLQTMQSSLEDIFVGLLKEGA